MVIKSLAKYLLLNNKLSLCSLILFTLYSYEVFYINGTQQDANFHFCIRKRKAPSGAKVGSSFHIRKILTTFARVNHKLFKTAHSSHNKKHILGYIKTKKLQMKEPSSFMSSVGQPRLRCDPENYVTLQTYVSSRKLGSMVPYLIWFTRLIDRASIVTNSKVSRTRINKAIWATSLKAIETRLSKTRHSTSPIVRATPAERNIVQTSRLCNTLFPQFSNPNKLAATKRRELTRLWAGRKMSVMTGGGLQFKMSEYFLQQVAVAAELFWHQQVLWSRAGTLVKS